MRIHFIAIGGAAMHNLALALRQNGHEVSGSDDEIYNPARDRLDAAGLLPPRAGWFPEKIDRSLDCVILGMHARADNPELAMALSIGVPVFSYPEFLYEQSRRKKRFVVAGSHGKTTTTAMAMHCLRRMGLDFDYLVGAQVQGFDTMARLSDAPVLIVEGDEYFASPLDPTPKMVRYRPHHAVVTGIAWDHVNVFPTFENYCAQFEALFDAVEPGGKVSWYAGDPVLARLIETRRGRAAWQSEPFEPFAAELENGRTILEIGPQEKVSLEIFGEHNLLNARAAFSICRELGVEKADFLRALASFKGAAKRLQTLAEKPDRKAWLDFAHAPSKVRATVAAVKNLHPDRKLVACLELHTFSSLSRQFLPEYRGALQAADRAFVFYSPHTLEMKRLPVFSPEEVREAFGRSDLQVFTQKEDLEEALLALDWPGCNLLLMSSGTFDGLDVPRFVGRLFTD